MSSVSIASSMGLCRLGYMLAIGVATTIALWPWVQGPALVAIAQFSGWTASGLIVDIASRRELAWKRALAQGLVSAASVWLTLRWLAD